MADAARYSQVDREVFALLRERPDLTSGLLYFVRDARRDQPLLSVMEQWLKQQKEPDMAQQNTQQGQPQGQGQAQQAGPPPSLEHAQLRQHGLDDATIHRAAGLGANLGALLKFVQEHPEIRTLLGGLLGLFGQGGTQPAAGQKP